MNCLSRFSRLTTGPRRGRAALLATCLVALTASAAGCRSLEPHVLYDAGPGTLPASDPPYLWYAGAGLNAFTEAQTRQSTNAGAHYYLSPGASGGSFHDLVFDAQGNLWAIPFPGDQVIRLPAAGLPPAVGPPTADLSISSPELKSPQNLSFDPQGNLWVVSYNGAGTSIATVVRFDDPSAQTGTVTLRPSAVIGPGSDEVAQRRFTQPSAIAFDGAGNLWLATTTTLQRFDAPWKLSGQVAPAPAAIVEGGATYASVAPGAGGALWVTGVSAGYFAERFDLPESLSTDNDPVADAKLLLPSSAQLFAGGMAVDAEGGLWVAMDDKLLKVASASSVMGGVTVTADVILATPAPPDLTSKLVLTGAQVPLRSP